MSSPLRFELRAALTRLAHGRSVRRFRAAKNLLVRVGAGAGPRPGWVSLDLVRGPGVDCVYDCRKSLPFPDASARAILCDGFLGRVDYTEEVPYFLAECVRVLRPGGVLRIEVPDFEGHAEAYCAGHTGPAGQGGATAMELLNDRFRHGWREKYAYDFESVQGLLTAHGFADVRRQAAGVSAVAEIAGVDPAPAVPWLCVEGFKERG